MRRLLIGSVALLLVLPGCMDLLTDSSPSLQRHEDALGDAPTAHDIAWAAWDPDAPRFEVGMASGSVAGSQLLVSIFDLEGNVGAHLIRTDQETILTHFSDCHDCSWEERPQRIPVETHVLEDGAAWTWTPLEGVTLSWDFEVQTIGSDERVVGCVYDLLTTGVATETPICGAGNLLPGPLEPGRVVHVVDGRTCTTAIWDDASLFAAALRMDEGDLSVDHNVTEEIQYVAPREGLKINQSVVDWPHSIRTLSVGGFEDSISLYGLLSLSSNPWIEIVASNEDEAKARGKTFLNSVSNSGAQQIDEWLYSLEIGGRANEKPIYRTQVGGTFRIPEELLHATPAQTDLRSADLESGDWRASLSLPLYRIRPEQGFIELSPLGDIQASLEPEPSFREAADAVLARHSLGPSTFDEFMEFDHFGRTHCGDQTLA